jgi:hypothetical protein
MKKCYNKPELFSTKDPHGIVPLGVALAGLALFVAGGAAGGVAAATALSTKKSGNSFARLERLPSLDIVEVYA